MPRHRRRAEGQVGADAIPTSADLVVLKLNASTGGVLPGACFTGGLLDLSLDNQGIPQVLRPLIRNLLVDVQLGNLGCTDVNVSS